MDVKREIPCEVYSRVVGYYRPVSNWNKGKKKEFSERTEFKINDTWKRQYSNLKVGDVAFSSRRPPRRIPQPHRNLRFLGHKKIKYFFRV